MPDTLNYMIGGYGIGIGLLAALVASLWWRYRSLTADEHTLQQLQAEVEKTDPPEARPRRETATAPK
jgi:hypothetical protein